MTTDMRRSLVPCFETSRLKMRGHTAGDFDSSRRMWSDERVTRFIGRPQTAEESWSRLLRYAGQWTLLGFGYWVIEEKEKGEFVGEVGFANYMREMTPSLGDALEAGWVLCPAKSGCGYATEAVLGALAWARQAWDGKRTVCIVDPAHLASMRVAAKCGFEVNGPGEYKGKTVLVMEQWLTKG